MEGILYQRVSPLLKCVVLFLFIFTAKVLTTRPQESQDGKNSIHHLKPSHFVRTFTKYHHRRTIQWNQDYWPTDDHPKVIQKRNAEVPYSNLESRNWNELSKKIAKRNAIPISNDFIDSGNGKHPLSLSESLQENYDKMAISVNDNGVKNGFSNDKNSVSNEVKKYKVKQAYIPTSTPPTQGPTISCVYKMNSISRSATPSYDDEKNEDIAVENESFEIGPVSEHTLESGETVQVEQCTDSRAYCYTLWHQETDGNVTVLGQGCWHAAVRSDGGGCGGCSSVPRLPDTKFCCCTTSYCNHEFMSLQDETVTMKAESTRDPSSQRASYSNAVLSAIILLFIVLVTLNHRVEVADHVRYYKCNANLFGRISSHNYDRTSLTGVGAALHRLYCRKRAHATQDVEKVEVMGSGPDALATGLLCVDNLTLIEHIGQGKFGSVWRGTLGATPVAVKLYSNASTWQKEAAIYALPHLSHPNILRYYGSDTRSPLEGTRSHLVVLELCEGSLRGRLQSAPLSWTQFAHLAHGLAAALAHLHAHSGGKPCVVHRDVNSNNVLIVNSSARLADLGLAQVLPPRAAPAQPSRITEAGTLRYLAPEALEGALDLSEARAALCAVDVFALGLVLWEMLWRCAPAHGGSAPPYAPPYHHHRLPANPTLAQLQEWFTVSVVHGTLVLSEARAALCAVDVFALGLVLWEMLWRCAPAHGGSAPPYAPPYHHHRLPANPTLAQLQSLVSRNKARPPLPRGAGVTGMGARALRVAADTCDECWDHDAEARLTAVCVEERMLELKTLLHTPHTHTHDNLHTHHHAHPESHTEEKNSNCLQQNGDVTNITVPPLLYPAPHVGRNACIQRNTLTNTHTTTPLIHKSLKDIPQDLPQETVQEENCLSVARANPNRLQEFENSGLNEIRSYQRPLDFVPNDVSNHDRNGQKQTNLLQDLKEKPKWGIRKFFEKKLGKNKLETEVKLVPESSRNNSQNGRTKTSLVNGRCDRPSNLVLDQERNFNFEVPCLSPPNRTLSPTMLMESDLNRENRVFSFKELPSTEENKTQNQIFAVIVPKAQPTDYPNLIELQNKRGSTDSMKNSVKTSMSCQSFLKSGQSESDDSTMKKRLSCDNRILNSGRSSRASINLELQYMDNSPEALHDSPYDLNSDCSTSEDEQLMLLSENGGSKITMQTIPKPEEKKKQEVLKESSLKTEVGYNFQIHKYKNFDNEFSDPNDKENLIGYSGDNPVYLAALNGEIDTADLKLLQEPSPKSPKLGLKSLAIKRQHSLEQVSEIFASSGEVNLQNPAGRVKTPGDLPVAIRRARRDRALQKGRANECNRLSLYDDRMMFGNSL